MSLVFPELSASWSQPSIESKSAVDIAPSISEVAFTQYIKLALAFEYPINEILPSIGILKIPLVSNEKKQRDTYHPLPLPGPVNEALIPKVVDVLVELAASPVKVS